MATTDIALVGAGRRGPGLLNYLYQLRDQNYLHCDAADDEPHTSFDHHASEPPSWVEDVSDLEPRVSAVFDPDPNARERAAAACANHGDDPELFASQDSFLEAGAFDAVIVSSPNDTHTEILFDLLERDVDVLCEKPLATTLAAHDRIADAVDASDAVFYTGFNLRSAPLFVRTKALLADGIVGELGTISAEEVRHPLPDGYRYERARSGGALLEKNCHDFDLLNWFMDADPVRVTATGGQHVLDRDSDVVDHANVVIEYGTGQSATLELCLFAPDNQGRRYVARGSEGLLETHDDGRVEFVTRDRQDTFAVGSSHRDEGGELIGHGGADVLQFKRFLRCLEGEDTPPAGVMDAKKAAAVAIGATRSIETGDPVGITSEYDLLE